MKRLRRLRSSRLEEPECWPLWDWRWAFRLKKAKVCWRSISATLPPWSD